MTTQRLFWNFEYQNTQNFNLDESSFSESASSWEIRYFWSNNKIIQLASLPENCFEFSRYVIKHRDDEYILNPRNDDNIKIRKNKLVFKPLLAKKGDFYNFGKKSPFLEPITITKLPHLIVSKETLHFPCDSHTRLEFTRFSLTQNVFFSFAITSNKVETVEKIHMQIKPQGLCCSYIEFLKRQTNHD